MFNLMITLITLLFTVACGVTFILNRQLTAAGWVSLTFFFGLLALIFDQNRALLAPYGLEILAEAAFLFSCCCLVQTYFSRFQGKPNFKLMGMIFFSGLAIICAVDTLAWRYIVMDLVAAIIYLYGGHIIGSHRKILTVNLLFWFNVAVVVVSVLRPMILIFDIAPPSWNSSLVFYETMLYLTATILGVIGTNIIFVAIGSDLIKQHQTAARVDLLTGLMNRRGMADIFQEVESGGDPSRHIGRAILLFDIDHFKHVNDEFGHDVGDTVLANIGNTVAQLMQYHGQASRSGGEEFMILFNAESSPAAFLVAEHLRVAISLLKHDGMPGDRRVTASFGLAFIRPGEPAKRFVRRADVALYAAKDAGRNRLRLADGDSLPDIDESVTPFLPKQRRAG